MCGSCAEELSAHWFTQHILYKEYPGAVHTAAVNIDEAFLSWNLQYTVGRAYNKQTMSG